MNLFWNKNKNKDFADPFVIKESLFGDAKIRDPLKKHWMEEAFLEKEGTVGMQVSFKEPVLGLTIGRRKLTIILTALAFLFSVLVVRAADLQILRGEYYRQQAENNSLRIESIAANRGVIYDRNGKLLAANLPNFSLTIVPNDLPGDKAERYRVIARLADLISMSPTEIDAEISKYGRYLSLPILIKDGLDYNSVVILMTAAESLPGVRVAIGTRRNYLSPLRSMSHLLGYEGRVSPNDLSVMADRGYLPTDKIGRVGVEAYYEKDLRGQPGRKKVEIDAMGREKKVAAKEEPVDGQNLVLSIDSDLQGVLESALRGELAALRKYKGVGIVLNAKNGEVLSMVSFPTYDNNLFAGGISRAELTKLNNDKNHPLLNRAISGFYPSGSTIKPFLAAAALQEKIIDVNTDFLSVGGIRIGQWFYPDWKVGGHGATNVIKALAESVNTFFYIIGGGDNNFTGLGIGKIDAYLAKFGFGGKLGIDLPAEGSGFLPTPEWKMEMESMSWFIGDTYHVAIGQGGLLVTPLQIAAGIVAVANGGTLYRPHLLRDDNATKYILNKDFISKDNLDIVRRGMRATIVSGSAQSLGDLPIQIAGKTGTAQWSTTEPSHAWFVGFGPYQDPQIVVVVLIEAGGDGSSTAAPVAEKVFDWWAKNRMQNLEF